MTIGFTCGAFDLLHAGHHIFLRDCKTRCDKLLVGLHTDPTIDRPNTKNKPIQTVYERYTQLINSKWVDEVIPYDTEQDLYNIIATTVMDIRFLGEDYRNKKVTAKDLCDELKIKIMYVDRKHNYSSSELRKKLSNDPITIEPLVFIPTKGSLF